MILAKARVIRDGNGRISVGLSFPTGFEPEEVEQESVRGNGIAPPAVFHVSPRRGSLEDLYRELEVSFDMDALSDGAESRRTLQITGNLRRGLRFKASVPLALAVSERDH